MRAGYCLNTPQSDVPGSDNIKDALSSADAAICIVGLGDGSTADYDTAYLEKLVESIVKHAVKRLVIYSYHDCSFRTQKVISQPRFIEKLKAMYSKQKPTLVEMLSATDIDWTIIAHDKKQGSAQKESIKRLPNSEERSRNLAKQLLYQLTEVRYVGKVLLLPINTHPAA